MYELSIGKKPKKPKTQHTYRCSIIKDLYSPFIKNYTRVLLIFKLGITIFWKCEDRDIHHMKTLHIPVLLAILYHWMPISSGSFTTNICVAPCHCSRGSIILQLKNTGLLFPTKGFSGVKSTYNWRQFYFMLVLHS